MSEVTEQATTSIAGTFRKALQGPGLALSAELALKRNSGAEDIAAQAARFRGLVDGVQVPDNPLAWVHMSALAASSLLLAQGLDPIPMMSCRDRNRIALLSDLLGLRALGVDSVMLGRGRRLPKDHALHASTVFDMTGRELIALAAELGEEAGARPFFIGTGAKVHRANPGWSAEGLTARSEVGAQFLQTQLCCDLPLLKHWLDRLVEAQVTWRYSIVISLTPFPDLKTARWMKEQMKDTRIPEAILERLDGAQDEEAEGVAICSETLQAIAELPGVSGVHFPSTGRPDLIAAAIEASGLRAV